MRSARAFLLCVTLYQAKAWNQLGADVGQSGVFSVSLSSDGTRLAIGEPGYATNAGRVYVYEYSSSATAWAQLGAYVGEYADDRFGFSVSLSSDGTRMAIGAPGYGPNAGRVRVYQYSAFGDKEYWVKLGGDIVCNAPYINVRFGHSV